MDEYDVGTDLSLRKAEEELFSIRNVTDGMVVKVTNIIFITPASLTTEKLLEFSTLRRT
jgi:phosphotransferase system IIA component